MSSYGPINNKKRYLILSKGPTQSLDDATLNVEYSITEQQKNFCLSLHSNESCS